MDNNWILISENLPHEEKRYLVKNKWGNIEILPFKYGCFVEYGSFPDEYGEREWTYIKRIDIEMWQEQPI